MQTSIYEPLYSAVHPMKCTEGDAMRYNIFKSSLIIFSSSVCSPIVWNLKLPRDCANVCCALENSERGGREKEVGKEGESKGMRRGKEGGREGEKRGERQKRK